MELKLIKIPSETRCVKIKIPSIIGRVQIKIPSVNRGVNL